MLSDIERYSTPSAPDPLDAIQAMLNLLREHRREIAELRSDVESVQAIAAESRDWMTLMGFVSTYRVQVDTDVATMSNLGSKIRVWHLQTNRQYKPKGAHHPVFGRVALWQVRHLADFFNDGGYRWDRLAFGEDYL